MSFIEAYYLTDRSNDLRSNAIVMSGIVAGVGFNNLEEGSGALSNFERVVTERSNEWGVRILVINDRARVIDDSSRITLLSEAGNTLIRPGIFMALNGDDTTRLRREDAVLYATATVQDTLSGRVGAVLLVEDVADIFESLADIRNMLFLSTLGVALLVVVLVVISSHRLISPLRNIVRVVERTAVGQLNLRIPVSGKDEYAILATTLNDMTEKLEQVERTRQEFVSNVSHEMKTPLSAIKVLSEAILAEEHVKEETYREFLQDIVSEVDRMTMINHDLLALVKADQRESGITMRRMDLPLLVEDILKRLAPLAEMKKVALVYEMVRPVELEADEIQLSLAISNIVENGIKYTHKEGVVRVVIDADHQYAFITIQDTGIGIPESEHDKIFNRFYRVDKARDRETGGTGLGLAISRATVLMHNGSIRLQSKPDEGSTFMIRLPLRR